MSAADAAFVSRGGRDVDCDFATASATAGAIVAITAPDGSELGLAVADPENGKLRVLAVPSDGLSRIDGALLALRVERALGWRRTLGLVADHAAYRLIHGAGDGLPGFACDVFGRVAVVYAYGEALRPLAHQLAETIAGFGRLSGVVIKSRLRGAASDVEQTTIGTVSERSDAVEAGVSYQIHPLGGLNAGLFTDMREHRARITQLASGRRTLNLFSYTGSLGLAAARGGAASVVNVDTSAGVHQWAKVNFAAAGFVASDPRWRFEVAEASRFLVRAARDRERYDLIIIDPPGASSAGGVGWALGRDYPQLIAKAAAVLERDGLMWLASNAGGVGALTKLAHTGLRAQPGAGERAASVVELAGLPPEYPTLVSQPSDRYLQVCLLRLG